MPVPEVTDPMTMRFQEDDILRLGRRALLLGAAGAVATRALPVLAQDDEDDSGDGGNVRIAEVPSFGARRPGPVEARSGRTRPRTRTTFIPVQLSIPAAAVDAPVEVGAITPDGVMLDPSGAWVVTWYDVLGAPGAGGNVVMSGHLDYWDVGPAVFYNVPSLAPGSLFNLYMVDGTEFVYELEWAQLFNVAFDLTPEVIARDVVGDTGREALTLITCGGEFDYNSGEYLYRWVIRANKV
jgi:hypothetical protein